MDVTEGSPRRRAHLKVYLGMAAGVGKTVAMLREAHRLRVEGHDVVGGLVETHGRAETVRELADLPLVALARRAYKGVELEEMDLDALLARRPEIAVVDELAHTNVPGGRHEKRYQDVEALLNAGIGVLGAFNVQHLESLHDLVLKKTGVDVRERLPDRFLDRADEIVVIDVPPVELQRRLRDGKIYPAHKVDQALASFFREENLDALRQIALREVANEVEERARDHVRTTRTPRGAVPMRAGEAESVADAQRVMVCMSSQPSATERLLRAGSRIAGGLNSRWFVVYVRTPDEATERIDTTSLRRLTDNITLAKELGAEVARLEGTDVVEALANFTREKGITHAVFGRTRAPVWRERLFGSLLERFMRAAPQVDVLVVGTRERNVTS